MGYSSIICTYTKGPLIPSTTSTCSLSWLWSLTCSRNMFSTSPNIMHRTQAIINFRVLVPSTLSSSPLLTWTWIVLLDIINVFHLSLACPHSYHHIPHPLRVKVQCVLRILLVQLVVDPSNITTWHAFLLFHSWCLSFLPRSGEKGHHKTHTHLHWYMVGDWETLQEEHTIKTHALAYQRSSKMALNPIPPPSAWLCHTWALAHVGEYVRTMCALAPNTFVAPSTKTIVTLCHLHPLVEVDLPLLSTICIQKQILFWTNKHLFLLWHVSTSLI